MSKSKINVRDYQKTGERSWDLPTWNYPLAQGIMPLCAIVNEHLIPVGSAFLISKLGIIATAAHVVQEALREDDVAHEAIISNAKNKEYSVKNVQLAVLHHRQISDQNIEVNVWPIENIQIAKPTDVAFGFLKYQQKFPYLSFTLSPAAPRIGEKVLCLGFFDSKFPDGGIPLKNINDGTFDWNNAFSHRFHVTEGNVEALFVNHFCKVYADGPCFLLDCELEHGQSGGPIFNSEGNVCGINLGGASILLGKESSLASMIYPALAVKIKFSFDMADALHFTATQPLINLINNGITTDGSEKLARLTEVDCEVRVDPLIHHEDANSTFKNFHGYQDSNPAIPKADSRGRRD
jgi:hypothetical protein